MRAGDLAAMALEFVYLILFVAAARVTAQNDEDASSGPWVFVHTHLMLLWMNRFYIYTCAAIGITIWICSHLIISKKSHQGEVLSQNGSLQGTTKSPKNSTEEIPKQKEVFVSAVKIFYGSQTGTAKGFARDLAEDITPLGVPVEIINMKDYDPDDNLVEETTSRCICVFLVATYTDGQPTESAKWFCKWLEEASNDFRFGKTFLKGLRYAVFGLGNSVYISHYNTVAKNIDKWLWMLSATRIMTRTEGDCNVVKSKHGSIEADFGAWKTKFLHRLEALLKGEKKTCSGKCKKGKCKSKTEHSTATINADQNKHMDSEHDDSEQEALYETTSESESEGDKEAGGSGLIDVEDLGKAMSSMKKAKMSVEMELR